MRALSPWGWLVTLRQFGPVILALAPALAVPIANQLRTHGKLRAGRARRDLDPPPTPNAPIALPPPANDEADPWSDEVAAIMLELGYPPALDRSCAPRAPDAPAEAGRRFLRFLLATSDLPLPRMRSHEVYRRYREFCQLDHRKPVPDNKFLGVLKDLPGVDKRQITEHAGIGPGRCYQLWTIVPPQAVVAALPKPAARKRKAVRKITKRSSPLRKAA